jgi:hypothetical protein
MRSRRFGRRPDQRVHRVRVRLDPVLGLTSVLSEFEEASDGCTSPPETRRAEFPRPFLFPSYGSCPPTRGRVAFDLLPARVLRFAGERSTLNRARLAPVMISTPGHRVLRRRQCRALPVWFSQWPALAGGGVSPSAWLCACWRGSSCSIWRPSSPRGSNPVGSARSSGHRDRRPPPFTRPAPAT